MADSRRFGPFTRFKFQNKTVDQHVDAELRLKKREQPYQEPADAPHVPPREDHENAAIIEPDVVEVKVTVLNPWRELSLAVDDPVEEDIQEVEASLDFDVRKRLHELTVLIRYADHTKEKTDKVHNP